MTTEIQNAIKILPYQWKIQLCRRLKTKNIQISSTVIDNVLEKGETPKHYLEILEEFTTLVQEVSQKRNSVFQKLENVLNN